MAIAKLKEQPTPLITRFAPSPTGYLHLGHLGHILYLWTIAKATDAQIILRMEDHDRTRCKLEFENSIFDDLAWLGLGWSNRSFHKGVQNSPFRQSDCLDMYEFQLQELKKRQLIYRCTCSRKHLQNRLAHQSLKTQNTELAYDGYCYKKNITDKKAGLRLSMEDEDVTFNDLLLGKITQNPKEQCGDVLVKDRHNNFTYQWTVTLDDLRHQVNFIIRGQDLTESTGRQMRMQQILGHHRPPFYLHHPLLRGNDGHKLSKSARAASLAERRANGETRETLIGNVIYALGLSKKNAPLSFADAGQLILEHSYD